MENRLAHRQELIAHSKKLGGRFALWKRQNGLFCFSACRLPAALYVHGLKSNVCFILPPTSNLKPKAFNQSINQFKPLS